MGLKLKSPDLSTLMLRYEYGTDLDLNSEIVICDYSDMLHSIIPLNRHLPTMATHFIHHDAHLPWFDTISSRSLCAFHIQHALQTPVSEFLPDGHF